MDLQPGELERLALPPRLRTAVEVGAGLSRKKSARGRQARLVGKLLRGEDHSEIALAVERIHERRRSLVLHEAANEAWRQRLLEGGDSALQELLLEYPGADRQRLRQLQRGAIQDPDSTRSKRSTRELLRAIRELRETPPDAESAE